MSQLEADPSFSEFADGRTDLVHQLLAQGHSPGSVDENGTSLMQWCAYYGDVSAMKFLLLQGAKLDSLGHNLGLNGAVFHGHWRFASFCLNKVQP